MNELKAFDIVVAEEGYCEGFVKYRRAVYDKVEADTTIEELKQKLHDAEMRAELAYERREVFYNLERLKNAIEEDPEDVSAHHKELWRKQAKAMQEYVDILGERIKDLIDND